MHPGSDDELVSVENYILKKCYRSDVDDSAEFQSAVDGDGWQGWHCEGSVLYAIFGLLMWDVIYSDLPDVFLTPYQDAPLDMLYSSYYISRYVRKFILIGYHVPLALIIHI